jgi:heat shock protein HslJ
MYYLPFSRGPKAFGKFALLLIVFIGVVACHHKSVPHTKVEPPGEPLENTYWKLVELSGINGNLPPTPKQVYLQLKNGVANGFSGCNSFFGGYSIVQDSIHFSSIAGTEMYCAKTMDLESNMLYTLAQVNRYHTTGNQLMLIKDHTVLAVFQVGKP